MCDSDRLVLKIPGSTSNLGSGFDTVSAALGLYLTLTLEETSHKEIEWVADWELSPEENLIAVALAEACRTLDIRPHGLRIRVENQIPLKRGLGSSAAAIVGGILVAARLAGKQLNQEEIFRIAYPLEGHPDNLSASLLGGWVISRVVPGGIKAERLVSAIDCRFVMAVPETVVSTQHARETLPDDYDLSDAVFNLQRCALLIHAVCSGNGSLLSEATQDRLHQEHRAGLVPGVHALLSRAALPEELKESLFSTTISGSGSAVLAIAGGHYEAIGEWMVSVLQREGTTSQYLILDLDDEGAHFLNNPVRPSV